MIDSNAQKTAFMLALDALEGLGRVRVKRLITAFPTYSALKALPFEQALMRMKGIPKANALLTTLLDEDGFKSHLEKAEKKLAHLSSVYVKAIHDGYDTFPKQLHALEGGDCPNILYGFGEMALLPKCQVSFFGKPPIASVYFELAQDLCRYLLAHNVIMSCGISNGFDTVIHKLASGAQKPTIMLTHCGLAHVAPSIRPQIMQSVRAGGLLCSSFDFDEVFQEPNEYERTLVQAALAPVNIFVAPKANTPESRAMKWALAHEKAVFSIGGEELPSEVQPIETESDFAWVLQASGL